MSVVTSAVIVVCYAGPEATKLLTKPQLFGRVEGREQAFRKLDEGSCGGGKALQSDIYAAGFNHISTEALVGWFQGLPWGHVDEAVLIFDCEGDERTVICTPGWERPAEVY